MKTLNPFPFLSLFFFFVIFSIGFYPKSLPTAFRSTRHHYEKNTANETKEALCERAKKRDRFFFRARLKRDEEENKNVESNDGVGIGIVVGERSLAGEPTER